MRGGCWPDPVLQMTAQIHSFPRDPVESMSDIDLLIALGISLDPEPRVDHWAGYRAQRAASARAAFHVIERMR